MGVDVTLRDAGGFESLGAIKTALTGEYDLILGNVRIGLYLGYPLARLRRVPFFGDVSDPLSDIDHFPTPLYELLSRYEWWILDHSEQCFFVESHSYKQANERGLNPILVRNAVDYPAFSDPSESSVSRAREILETNGVDTTSPIAIYLGSMIPEYNIEELIRAAELTPEWEFVFLGEERGVPVSNRVADCENVHYLGTFNYDLVPGFLSHAACGLCLADKEQPLKIMEYGAAGLPTIGYDGKLRQNFSEEELLFVDADPKEISETLLSLSEKPGDTAAYGAALQERAKNHSWKAVAETYYEELQKVSQ
jgi:glycosyltransferase involved in cell wall biosynthesis